MSSSLPYLFPSLLRLSYPLSFLPLSSCLQDDDMDDENDDADIKGWLGAMGMQHLQEFFARVRISSLREARALSIDVSKK